MAKVFAIANQKGGVGKTTTCINLAASLVATKRRVLLIDLDPQGNATMGSGVDKLGLENSVYDLLIGECDLAQAMHYSEHGGYQLLPANRDLTAAEVVLLEMQMKESRLRSALAPIRENYDYILIDCPPQLSILTINALSCADGVLIPVKTDYLAYRGLTQLQDSIREIQELINPDLKVLGVIATLYDARVSDDKDILALLKDEYNLVGVVKRLAVAKKGIYDGLAVVEQAPSSEIAKEYTAIAKMIINGNFDREDIENG